MPKFRDIIRIRRANLDGAEKATYALTGIKGVGIRLASAIVERAGIDKETRLGFLSDSEVRKTNDVLENPAENNTPSWLFNRQRDRHSGEDLHLMGPDLDLQIKSDIDLMKRMDSWKGLRHSYGLKVRGQKTRTTGRKRRAVGVRRRQAIGRLKKERSRGS